MIYLQVEAFISSNPILDCLTDNAIKTSVNYHKNNQNLKFSNYKFRKDKFIIDNSEIYFNINSESNELLTIFKKKIEGIVTKLPEIKARRNMETNRSNFIKQVEEIEILINEKLIDIYSNYNAQIFDMLHFYKNDEILNIMVIVILYRQLNTFFKQLLDVMKMDSSNLKIFQLSIDSVYNLINFSKLEINIDGSNERLNIIFSFFFGFIITKEQNNLVNQILNYGSNPKINQLLMGRGKTSVITPLLSLKAMLYKKHIDRNLNKQLVVLPAHLVKPTKNIFNLYTEINFFEFNKKNQKV